MCQIAFARTLGILSLALVLAGCAAPGPRVRYLDQIEAPSLTSLLAYRSGTNLEIRIRLRGKDAFAHASWPAVGSDATNYQHRFAILDFSTVKHPSRRALTSKANLLPVHDLNEWQQLRRKIFSSLVPQQPGHGVLLLVQNQEIVIFTDGSGKMSVVKLENKPPDVIVDRTCNEADFTREAIKSLEAGVASIQRGQNQFLFITGEDPAFVLVDVRQRMLVFLDYPSDPDAEPVPVWFAVRALNTLIVRSLLVTAVKNPFTLVCRGFWHIGNSGAAAFSPALDPPDAGPPPLLATNAPMMDIAAWEKDLDHIVSDRRYKGRADLFINGDKFFPALIDSIANARRSVDMQVFIFDNDDYAVRIADLLKQRSKQVRVKVLMDDMGSLFASQADPESPMPPGFQRPDSIQAYLTSGSRVHVRASANPWLTVDHRKCVIVDGRVAFVGGMNIGRDYRYAWHDMMIGLTGPIVGRLEKDYRLAWAHAGPLGDFAWAWNWLFDRASPRKNPVPNAIDLRPLRTATGKIEIYRAQLAAIDHARRRVEIENPYFQDDSVFRALVRARHRGVDVRVIFPARNDSGVMQLNNSMVTADLLRNGIRVYAYPGMTHVKAAIFDGWACVGSANLDKMSLRIGQELDIGFSDPQTVDKLQHELFDADFAHSREITTPAASSWFDAFVKAFTDQL